MKKLLDKIFKLPPVEKRPDLSKSRWRIWLNETYMQREDNHVRRQLLCVTSYVCLFVGLLCLYVFLTKETLNIFVMPLVYSPETPVAFLTLQYARIVQILLFLFILPFFIVKLHFNFDAKKNSLIADLTKHEKFRNRKWMLSAAILLVLFIKVGFHVTPLIAGKFILKFFYSETVWSLIFHLLFTWVMIFTWGTIASFCTYTLFWRYVGPYDASVKEYLINGRIYTQAELNERIASNGI